MNNNDLDFINTTDKGILKKQLVLYETCLKKNINVTYTDVGIVLNEKECVDYIKHKISEIERVERNKKRIEKIKSLGYE